MADAGHPYPGVEHYAFPVNVVEAMADNRRLYKDGKEMLVYSGKYIPGLYGGEPLFEYFTSVSRMLFVHQLVEGEVELPVGASADKAIDNEFYTGTLIGMDTRLSTMRPYALARRIMVKNPLEEYKRDGLTEKDRERFTSEMQVLQLFHSGLWMAMAKGMGQAYRYEVIKTARTLFMGIPHRNQQRQEVVAGIVFAHATIEKLKHQLKVES